jgi:hypothetical protein
VINDLDETIKYLLTKEVPLEPSAVDISFEAPDREWTTRISKPTVNIYLYDLRENHELRSYEWTVEHNHNNTATKKKAPPRVDLSYLVTVWAKHIIDEHRLLASILAALIRHTVLPDQMLQGVLKDIAYPIHASTAQPDGLLKNPADLWTALDNLLKPSINYVVTLPLELDIALTAPIVVTKTIEVKEVGKEGAEQLVQIGGIVHSKGQLEAGIANARVIVKEVRMTAITDSNGRYSFPKVARGNYTLQVLVANKPAKETRLVVPSDNYNLEL